MTGYILDINDEGNLIELYYSATKRIRIFKSDCKIKQSGDVVWLFDNSESSKVSGTNGEEQNYRLLNDKLTTPYADATALFNAVAAMLANVPGGDLVATSSLLTSTPYSNDDEIILLNENTTDRVGFIVFNDTTIDLYLKLGDAANTTTGYSFILSPGGSYESYKWQGIVSCAQGAGGSGRIQTTELLE